MCGECGEAMRVIDVVEKFGDDAERFLERVRKRKEIAKIENEEEEDYVSIDKEEPNIILMGDDDSLDNDGGIDPTKDEDTGLDVIFPDEDEDGTKSGAVDVDDDLAKALDQLDSEEEDDLDPEELGFDDGEIPTL